MRRALVQTGAWAAATGAAVALSWLGVNAVLSDAAFEAPQTLPLPVAASIPPPTAPASPSGTALGEAAEATRRPASAGPSPSAPGVPHTPAAKAPASTGSPAPSSVHSYLVPGGRLALDMHPDSADLVSATPDAGWKMEVWHGDQWMRVDFSQDGRTSSVFVTWNGHPPDVQTVPG